MYHLLLLNVDIKMIPAERSFTCLSHWWQTFLESKQSNLYIYKTEMSVRLFVCPSRFGGGASEGDGEGGQEGGGEWGWGRGCQGRRGGGISMMECQGGHPFPEQCRVTQLVRNNLVLSRQAFENIVLVTIKFESFFFMLSGTIFPLAEIQARSINKSYETLSLRITRSIYNMLSLPDRGSIEN